MNDLPPKYLQSIVNIWKQILNFYCENIVTTQENVWEIKRSRNSNLSTFEEIRCQSSVMKCFDWRFRIYNIFYIYYVLRHLFSDDWEFVHLASIRDMLKQICWDSRPSKIIENAKVIASTVNLEFHWINFVT